MSALDIQVGGGHYRQGGIQHPVHPSIHLDKRKFIEAFGTERDLLETLRSEIGE